MTLSCLSHHLFPSTLTVWHNTQGATQTHWNELRKMKIILFFYLKLSFPRETAFRCLENTALFWLWTPIHMLHLKFKDCVFFQHWINFKGEPEEQQLLWNWFCHLSGFSLWGNNSSFSLLALRSWDNLASTFPRKELKRRSWERHRTTSLIQASCLCHSTGLPQWALNHKIPCECQRPNGFESCTHTVFFCTFNIVFPKAI